MKRLSTAKPKTAMLLTEKLDSLATQRHQLETALAQVEVHIQDVRRDAVDDATVRKALSHLDEVFETLAPYQRKDLIRRVLVRAEVTDDTLSLALRGKPPQGIEKERDDAASRSEPCKWLLG